MTLPLFERDPAELLRDLTQVSHAVSNAASLEEILRLTAEQAAALIGVERSLVLLTDDAGGLRIRAQHGLEHVPSGSFAGALDERLISGLAGALGDALPEHVLAVPFVVRGRVTGILAVGPLLAVKASGLREAVLTALADQMAAPLENARLAEEVEHVRTGAETAVTRLRRERDELLARLQLQFERMPFACILFDSAGRVIDWNPAAERIFGYQREEVLGKHGFSVLVPSPLESVRDIVERLVAGDMDAQSVNANMTKDGRTIICDWVNTPLRDTQGTVIALMSMAQDITERTRVQAALRTSEERFRLATEVLAGFVFDWDVLTNRLEWFGDLSDVLGRRADEVVPDFGWYQSRVHPDDLPRANESVQAAFESGAAAYSNVYRFRHPDGHYVDVADRGRIIRDATGQAIRVLGGVNNISERRRFERERDELLERERQARLAAEAAIRARDEILGIVSHDLRNPLGAIALCAGALLEAIDPSAAEERRILQAIEHAATSTNRLIRDLLDVANIEAGHLAIDAHAEAPDAILAEAGEIFAAAAQQRGLTLETQTEPDLPAIRADAGRVHQALANLIVNALKFTYPGGHITLRSEHALGSVRFAVKDTGVGIAADDLPHVFDRYWQKRRSGGEPGVGLGLAIVRGIVDAHGGRLAVDSTPGKGSQFSFTIPTAT